MPLQARNEVFNICFVDINLKFIAVVRTDCWMKLLINQVNGSGGFYVSSLNDYSQSA